MSNHSFRLLNGLCVTGMALAFAACGSLMERPELDSNVADTGAYNVERGSLSSTNVATQSVTNIASNEAATTSGASGDSPTSSGEGATSGVQPNAQGAPSGVFTPIATANPTAAPTQPPAASTGTPTSAASGTTNYAYTAPTPAPTPLTLAQIQAQHYQIYSACLDRARAINSNIEANFCRTEYNRNMGYNDLVSPIAVNLDAKLVGFEGKSKASLFDLLSNGKFEKIARTNDARSFYLAFDRNRDGVVSEGNELFGNVTRLRNGLRPKNGFEALADWDVDQNGYITAVDPIFTNLVMWRDTNGDGLGVKRELVSARSLGIRSIPTSFMNSGHVDAHGNEFRQISIGEGANGQPLFFVDVWFRSQARMTAQN